MNVATIAARLFAKTADGAMIPIASASKIQRKIVPIMKTKVAFPKPHQVRRVPKFLGEDGIYRFPDGREVCALETKKGMDEYIRRKRVAWEKQTIIVDGRAVHICPICKKSLKWTDAMMDHIKPRGMGAGSRDDRQGNVQAVHGLCNTLKGSKRMDDLDILA